MKLFEFAGIIFNADNVCTIQKVNVSNEENDEKSPGLQVTTLAGGFNFTFKTSEERDEKFNALFEGLEKMQ